jgi:hypothetical protein
MATIKVSGAKHKVYKDKKGDVIVDHTAKKGGKYDKIDLTKQAGAKTVKQGEKATREWHAKHPHKKGSK